MRSNSRVVLAHLALMLMVVACGEHAEELSLTVYQTSATGDRLKQVDAKVEASTSDTLRIDPGSLLQEVLGFGGAFTESSAYLLNQLSEEKRQKIMQAYFADSGARYSLCRTHMNSCDFSLRNYSYAPFSNDTALDSFSIIEDMDDLIPMIKEAQKASSNGFKLIASPWTAPPWMKDNNDWNGGKLRSDFYDAWARFFVKYHRAYADQGIQLWGYTVENEPLGNDANWESMHYTPHEMADFIKNHLGPQFESEGISANILVYDQNRGEELEEWAEVLLGDTELLPYIYGTAVHWYTSTVDWFGPSLQYTHSLAPNKHIIHTEGCVDAEVPHWRDDAWYWTKEATDWGWDWAPEEDKPQHPKYVPVYRYARDIIGCLNNQVEGWIDWNMVLDRNGGPNHASNWCVAPVLVDPEADEIYFTPLYDVMCHFSRYIAPGAQVMATEASSEQWMATAVRNPDASIVVVALNRSEQNQDITIAIDDRMSNIRIPGQSMQTIVIESMDDRTAESEMNL